MTDSTTSSLSPEQISHPHVTYNEGPGGLGVLQIENENARAELSLYGGHVLSFQPQGASPILWLSEQAVFKKGTPIRGGVPICWPWFGPDPQASGRPSHGFARTSDWDLQSVESVEAGTQITLTLRDSSKARELWSHQFELTLTVTVGRELTLKLRTKNTGAEEFEITQALHSYFSVGDIANVEVLGLEGARYIDTVAEPTEMQQEGAVRFRAETDRDYIETTADCVINDRRMDRRIRISKSGSSSTIVWNPWTDRARALPDFPDDGFNQMVCVETANATEFDTIRVSPGTSHELLARTSVE